MSEFKGTKGGWYAKKQAETDLHYINNNDMGMGQIATCYSIMTENGNEVFANAKLIATAPEMLEMLIKIKDCDDLQVEDYFEIEQLIKKATEL